jgi:hypothetical protein
MGLIDPMVITSAIPQGGIAFEASSLVLWVSMVGLLGVTFLGIVAAVPRRRRVSTVLRLVPAAETR